MTEDFLHYIWKFQRFNTVSLKTTDGQSVQVLKPGEHNTNAGPDFFNAKIKIGDTVWAGNLEIHVNSSDWKSHYHNSDKAYDNVILHVVFNHDIEVETSENRSLVTLELTNHISEDLINSYIQLSKAKGKIPCESQLSSIDEFTIKSWQDRLVVERLERKSNAVANALAEMQNDWEETCYRLLAKNFGFKVNELPFELLSKSLPLKYLQKHSDDITHLESMILGQAGFLEDVFDEDYPNLLKKEFGFYKAKFKLEPIQKMLWKHLGLRPSNFPTVRLIQFAELISKNRNLFSKIIEVTSLTDLKKLFSVEPKGYWSDHYQLDCKSSKRSKKLGDASVDILIINTVIPILFWYGKVKKMPIFQDRAVSFLGELKPESNSIIKNWSDRGINCKSALETQSMLQLYNEYCSRKQCLNCALGNKILRS